MTDPHISFSGWWQREFGRANEAVRRTDAREHETLAEEQARWERDEPASARICEDVRRTKREGEEASRRADETRAERDARVATQRQANDAAQKAHDALNADRTARRRAATSRTSSQRRKRRSLGSTRIARLVIRAREGQHHMHATFAIASNDSSAPGIMCQPVSIHDEPAATTAPRGERQVARLRVHGPPPRNPVSNEPTRLEVQ